MELFKKLEEAGIDMKEFKANMLLAELAADMIDLSIANTEASMKRAGVFNQKAKQDLTAVSKVVKKYAKNFNASLNSEEQERYGELSDAIYDANIKFLKGE